MVSNISFGSAYKVSSKQNGFDKFWDFQNFAAKRQMQKGVQVRFEDSFAVKTKQYEAIQTMLVPDSLDKDVEAFCANRGIQFKKINTKEAIQPEAILDRIKNAPKSMRKVTIDAERLFEIAKNQNQNLAHCEKDYYNYYYDKVDFMLKTGDEIPATTLWISPSGSKVDDTLDYINTWGADNLNKEQIFVEFNQVEEDDPDHCIFFALKNMGIKEVPVYVNEDTYKLASALGILK